MSTEHSTVTQWLADNLNYGHLDEIPDDVLLAVLGDLIVGAAVAAQMCVVFNDGMAVTDRDVEKAAILLRCWMIVERLRRMGRLILTADVLIKEMVSACPWDYGAFMSALDGSPFTFKIVETQPGVITLVGEEIDLLKG